jgi:hypothetical protein
VTRRALLGIPLSIAVGAALIGVIYTQLHAGSLRSMGFAAGRVMEFQEREWIRWIAVAVVTFVLVSIIGLLMVSRTARLTEGRGTRSSHAGLASGCVLARARQDGRGLERPPSAARSPDALGGRHWRDDLVRAIAEAIR